ncbi:Prevent host death protein, Phd antitoxin [uncultured Leptolyngbya sp.]|uniref:Antitoxin n=1 Tax=uncultured Leptolyngbya sp. TaxID=332963 RepID=A0A6J4NZ74_9CYAN|nr:Prevent host death protein, Phd antitoxin [uncultured Leptolyngbya sp.]
MKTVGSYEAKTHLPRLLDEVAAGETIVITKHGHPVALLSPANPHKGQDVTVVINQLRILRQEIQLNGLSLQEMIDEGRRF